MRILSAILLVFLSFFPIVAQAQVSNPTVYTIRDCGISSLSGSSQTLVAANPNHKYVGIFNSGNSTVYVNFAGGTAATSGIASTPIVSGGSIIMTKDGLPRNAITIIGTAAQPVACWEGN